MDAISNLDANSLANHLEKKERLRKEAQNNKHSCVSKWSLCVASICLMLTIIMLPIIFNQLNEAEYKIESIMINGCIYYPIVDMNDDYYKEVRELDIGAKIEISAENQKTNGYTLYKYTGTKNEEFDNIIIAEKKGKYSFFYFSYFYELTQSKKFSSVLSKYEREGEGVKEIIASGPSGNSITVSNPEMIDSIIIAMNNATISSQNEETMMNNYTSTGAMLDFYSLKLIYNNNLSLDITIELNTGFLKPDPRIHSIVITPYILETTQIEVFINNIFK